MTGRPLTSEGPAVGLNLWLPTGGRRPQRAERPGDVSHADASYGTSRCLFSTRHIGDRGPRESIQIDRASLASRPPEVERKLRDDPTAAGLASSLLTSSPLDFKSA